MNLMMHCYCLPEQKQSAPPPIPGIELPGIHVFRTIPDSREILTALADAKHIVVVGAGYLGVGMIAVGVKPETTLAVKAGIELGGTGTAFS